MHYHLVLCCRCSSKCYMWCAVIIVQQRTLLGIDYNVVSV